MELSPAWWGTPAIQVLRRQKQENLGSSDSLVYTASPDPPTPRPWGAGSKCVFRVIYSVTNLQQHCKLAQLHSSYNQEFQNLESCPSSPCHWATRHWATPPCSLLSHWAAQPDPCRFKQVFVCLFFCEACLLPGLESFEDVLPRLGTSLPLQMNYPHAHLALKGCHVLFLAFESGPFQAEPRGSIF